MALNTVTENGLKWCGHSPLSGRLDRCDRMIQNESGDPNGGSVYYVTMQITFLTHKFLNMERNSHCVVVHITTVWVYSVTLDCNGVFGIKVYVMRREEHILLDERQMHRCQESDRWEDRKQMERKARGEEEEGEEGENKRVCVVKHRPTIFRFIVCILYKWHV